jgi:NADPH-dependent curcumin reductase
MSVPDRAVDRPLENTQVLLASRPTGVPTVDNFRIASAPIPRLGPGEVLLRTIFLSLDPYMRARMNAGGSYAAPVEVGSVMTGGTVSEVCASNHDDFEIGDVVLAHCGWQKFGVQPGAELRKLDPDVAPVSTALGVLGMPGFTAYAGLAEIGRPKAGETVVVAAASGPVGSTVGQLARIAGARVVGIVGGQRKVEHIRELGFDEALDHRAADFGTQLERATPDGIDVYFENVGGRVWEKVFPRLNLSTVLRKSLYIRGFIQTEFVAVHSERFLTEASQWIRDGSLRYREDIVDGLENAPAAFLGMLRGENFGKLIIRVG